MPKSNIPRPSDHKSQTTVVMDARSNENEISQVSLARVYSREKSQMILRDLIAVTRRISKNIHNVG